MGVALSVEIGICAAQAVRRRPAASSRTWLRKMERWSASSCEV
jgi:hypothetical protein